MADECKRRNYNTSTQPIQRTRVISVNDHLPNQTQRNRQAQPYRHHQRTRQQHGPRPTHIRDDREARVEQQNHPDVSRRGHLEPLDSGPVHDEEARPEEHEIAAPEQAEEEGHVDPALVAYAFRESDGVAAVEHRAEYRHGVARRDFAWRFEGEGAAVVCVFARDVDGGDEDNADEGGHDAP